MTGARAWGRYALYALAKIVPGLVLFAAVPVWMRVFGAVEYGRYTTTWVAALLTSSLYSGWIRQSVLRHAGDPSFDADTLPRWTVPASSAASALTVSAIVWVTGARYEGGGLLPLVACSAVLAAVNTQYALSLTRSQRFGHVGRYAAAETARAVGALLLSLPIARALPWGGAVAIVLAYAIATGLALLFLIQPLRRTPSSSGGVAGSVLLRFWAYGWPMAVWLTVSSMLLYADRFILGIFLGREEVGIYASMADLVVRGVGMVAFPLTMSTHPELMKLWNAGRRIEALHAARRYAALLGGLSVAALILGLLVGPWAIGSVLAVERPRADVVAALVAGAGLWQVGLMSHKPLEMADRTRTLLRVIGLVTIGSVICNFVLVPILGIAAPAYVFALGAALYVAATLKLGRAVEGQLPSETKGS